MIIVSIELIIYQVGGKTLKHLKNKCHLNQQSVYVSEKEVISYKFVWSL